MELVLENVKKVVVTDHAYIKVIEEKKAVFVKVTNNYIPMADFQFLFEKVTEIVKEKQIKKMIFDKSSLTTFHQPSMEWYHTHWKESMKKFGLLTYHKILPKDDFFVQSVKIGRDKIMQANPEFSFDDYQILYFDDAEQAIKAL